MQITYVKDGKTETFETRKGFDVKIEEPAINVEASWIGGAKDGYYTEKTRCDFLYGVTHFEVK